jgi:protein CpxP
MNRSSMARAAAVLAALALPCLSLPASALAQAVPAGATPASAAAPTPKQNVEAHIQALHDQLQITKAEEPQWTVFAQVMRNNATQMEQAFAARGASLETMNAVEDLQSYAQIAQIQSANMQKLAASFQTLYDGFPAAQQKLADGVFRVRMAGHAKPGMKSATP